MESESSERTEALGEAWGRVLLEGDLLLLVGELGSGKTTLVRGLARGLGIRHGVKSPSFAIHLEYPGRLTLHHLDLHRLGSPRDLDELGFEDFLGREGVSVVEWGEKLGDVPPWSVTVTIDDLGPTNRRFVLEGNRDAIERLGEVIGAPIKRASS